MTSTTSPSGFFHDFDLPEPILSALSKVGFETPTPIQAAAIPAALSGRDVLGMAQTGTGKTAAFVVPAIANIYKTPGKQALVLAPTRELAAQIFKVFKQIGQFSRMEGTLVVGGESFQKQARELREGVDFIVATPGRLVDHLTQGRLRLHDVTVLIFDEVDRTLDMGFLPQIQQIMKHVPKKRQTLLFSATLPEDRAKIINSFLDNPAKVTIGKSNSPIVEINQKRIETSAEMKPTILIEQLANEKGKVLVFTRTQARTERVARWLEKEGFRVARLHGGRTQGQRRTAMEGFRTGAQSILVATDLAGRGIDVNDIALVINYDLPGCREDYVHRIGRTGRAGKGGTALTLFGADERHELDQIMSDKPIKAAPPARKPSGTNRPQSNGQRKPHFKKTSFRAKSGESRSSGQRQGQGQGQARGRR